MSDIAKWEFCYDNEEFDLSKPEGVLVVKQTETNKIIRYDILSGEEIL